jgi:hypothetical protein
MNYSIINHYPRGPKTKKQYNGLTTVENGYS